MFINSQKYFISFQHWKFLTILKSSIWFLIYKWISQKNTWMKLWKVCKKWIKRPFFLFVCFSQTAKVHSCKKLKNWWTVKVYSRKMFKFKYCSFAKRQMFLPRTLSSFKVNCKFGRKKKLSFLLNKFFRSR